MVAPAPLRVSLAAALVITALLVPPAYADLGNCTSPPDGQQPHQGASEFDVPGNTKGLVSRVFVRYPDLCNNPPYPYDSASTGYVMLTDYLQSAQYPNDPDKWVWYQIGYLRIQGWSCPRWYMQYHFVDQPPVTDVSSFCAANSTWYTLVLRKVAYYPGYAWQSYVLTSDNCCYVWESTMDPPTLQFTTRDGEISAEVINEHDQSGGTNSLPMYLDSAYWWDVNYNVRYANWGAGEQFCNLCGSDGPYNVTYPDGDTLKVWTDGY